MPRRFNKIPRYLAIHEAGHAVVCWYTGTRFDAIAVRAAKEIEQGPHIDRRGRTCRVRGLVEVTARFTPEFGVTPRFETVQRINAQIDILIAYAGPLAEARYRRSAAWMIFLLGGDSDNEQAEARIQCFTYTEDEAEAMRLHLEKMTRAIFRESRIWEAVHRLATALQKRCFLEWEEALSIIQQETGEGERSYGYMLSKFQPP